MIKDKFLRFVCLSLSISSAPVFFISCNNSITNHQVKGPSILLKKVLSGEKRASDISTRETVEIFKECVDISKSNIEILQSQKGEYKKAIAIIGGTGSGKSTIINYLHGSKMRWVETNDGEKIIDVIEGGSVYAKLGHGPKSATLLPRVSVSKETSIACIDCPGLFNSSVVGVNVANGLIIKQMLEVAKDLSLIFMIDYGSLGVCRAAGLKDTMKQVQAFLGSEKEIIKNKHSFMFVVSKVDRSLKKINFLEAIVNEIIVSLETEGSNILELLKDRFFSYDPTENPIRGGMQKR